MDWDYGLYGKVPRVQIGMVVGLERWLECRLGLWLVLARINYGPVLRSQPPGQHVPPCVQYGTTCFTN
jgi:hypothetical protein